MQVPYIHTKNPLHLEDKRLKHLAKITKRFLWQKIDHSWFSNEAPLLEVGCGIGAQTAILLEKFPSFVLGIDIQSNFLAKAQENLSAYPQFAGRYLFCEMDATHLLFPDKSFSAAYSSFVLEHMPRENALSCLRDLKRIISPKGVIILNDIFLKPEEGTFIRDEKGIFPPLTKSLLNDLISWQLKRNLPGIFGKKELMLSAIKEAGFSTHQIELNSIDMTFSTKEDLQEIAILILYLFQSYLYQIDAKEKELREVQEELARAAFQSWQVNQAIIHT